MKKKFRVEKAKVYIPSLDFFVRDGGLVVARGRVIFKPQPESSVPIAEVHDIWTHEEYRRHGLARKIMNAIHKAARGARCEWAVLTSRKTKKRRAARALYRSLGYRKYTEGFRKKL